MIIREAKLEDAKAIARVHVDTWRTTYIGIVPEEYLKKLSYETRETRWLKMLSNAAEKKHFVYVAEDSLGEIIAFADGGQERSGNSIYRGELYAIYILAAYQRQGIGKKLIDTLANKLSESGLNSMVVWVLADNPACQFYQTLGGQKVDHQEIELEGVILTEVAYGWIDTKVLWQHST
jgi:GNAT superfamily N-acetyltransferase